MNWGKSIALVLALFIGFIMYMVITMMSTSIDLESDDYYEKEINYSSELNAISRDQKLKDRPSFIETENHFVVNIGAEVDLKNMELFLRRPNDQKDDKTYQIKGTKNFMLAKKDLIKGIYQVVLSYELDGESYIQKHEIII